MTTALQEQNWGLDNDRQNALAGRYNAVVVDLQTHLETAKTITVADDTDTKGMQAARATRLALKSIRVNVENTRKALKEASLREGKAIDGMANVLKYLIEPVETDLQAKEDFVRLAEERRKAALAADRAAKLAAFGVDCQHFDLANMADEGFSTLLSSSEAGYRARIAAEKAERERIEAERIAREKEESDRREAQRAENARIAAEHARIAEENAKLARQAAADRAARLQAEQAAQREYLGRQAAERREREAQQEAERRRFAAIQAAKPVDMPLFVTATAGGNLPDNHATTCPKCGHVFQA